MKNTKLLLMLVMGCWSLAVQILRQILDSSSKCQLKGNKNLTSESGRRKIQTHIK